MAEGTEPTTTHGKGVGGFLKGETAGLPNWAWILVIGAGIAAAVIVPKLLGKGQTQSTNGTTQGQDQSALGLAVDPTTGLPYAVSGLVPSGGTTSIGSTPPPLPGMTNTGPLPSANDQTQQQQAQTVDLSSTNNLLQQILNNQQTRQRPPTTQGEKATTRSNWPGESSGAQLPIWKSPQVDWSNTLGGIPKDTSVTIGQPTYGSDGKIYFPITYQGKQGYIASWDLGNLSPSVQNVSSNWPGNTTQQRIV